jgi:class 3 adenylate cyclase/tetratricopeptide (TPR) repeat protein
MISESAAAISGKRRWAAILFADVVGSTELAEQIGDEPFYGLMRDLMAESWSIVERLNGHMVEFGGDSLLAVFGAPVAVENASLNACRAALRIQEFADSAKDRFFDTYGHAPKFRVGVSGGVVTVGDLSINSKMSLNVLGSAVNLASRLEGMAGAGEVLISSRIHDQVENLVEAEDLGQQSLKGFAEPQPVFRLTNANTSTSVFEMRLRRGARVFAGRDAELETLTRWALRTPGERALIEIVGEAGIGKSRLLYELERALGGKLRIVSAACEADRRNISFYPLIRLICEYVNWSQNQPVELLKQRLAKAFGPETAQSAAFVDLLSGKPLSDDAGGRETAIEVRAGLTRVLQVMSADPTVALLVEDTHWIDTTSSELLSDLAAQGVLRAAITHRHAIPWEPAQQDRITTLFLTPLAQADLSRIVCSVLGIESVPDDLVTYVATTSDSLPLFAEEVVHFLRKNGQISIEDGQVTFTEQKGALSEAGNLQNLILSVFDTLTPEAQRCLEIAATKGRRFTAGFLETCVGDTQLVLTALDEVTNLGVIEADPRGGRRALRFSHALVADSIYRSILDGERRQLHRVVGQALEQEQDATAAELAFHFAKGDDPGKSVRFYWKAATEAMSVYAVDIADRQLEHAFALIEKSPDIISDEDLGELLVLQCRALDIYGNFRRLNQIIEKRVPRLAALGPSRNLAICLTLQALSRTHSADYDRALSLIEKATQVAEQTGDEASLAWVKAAKLRIYSDTEFAPTQDIEAIYREVRPVADRLDDRHVIQASIYNMQAAYRAVGEMKKAEALVEELEAFGRERKDSRALAYAHWAKAVLCFSKLDPGSLREATETVFKHAVPGTADWRVASVFQLAIALLEPDDCPDPGSFTRHMKKTREFEDFTLHHTTWVGRMMAHFKSGQIARGVQEMREMEVDFRKSATNELQRVMLVYQGEILLSVLGLRPTTGPRPKLGWRDILAFIRLRVFARRQAAQLFKRYLEQTPAEVGPLLARAHFGLGLLARSRGRKSDAKGHFDKAHDLYTHVGYDKAAAGVRAAQDAD